MQVRSRYHNSAVGSRAAESSACAGMAVVFHTATAAPAVQNTRSEAIMMAVNVDGTRNVIQACQAQRVPRLVYISSASVVWEGRDLLDVDETAPYAQRNLDFYGKTKVRSLWQCTPYISGTSWL